MINSLNDNNCVFTILPQMEKGMRHISYFSEWSSLKIPKLWLKGWKLIFDMVNGVINYWSPWTKWIMRLNSYVIFGKKNFLTIVRWNSSKFPFLVITDMVNLIEFAQVVICRDKRILTEECFESVPECPWAWQTDNPMVLHKNEEILKEIIYTFDKDSFLFIIYLLLDYSLTMMNLNSNP